MQRVGGEAVNRLWWQACIDRQGPVPAESMHCFRPAGASEPIAGMEHVSCTVTGFVGDGRKDIRNLLHLVGAQFSGDMQKGLTTHLICAEPAQGQKYEKAKQWGLKIVGVAWIQQVFEQWLHVDESEFLLGKGNTETRQTVIERQTEGRPESQTDAQKKRGRNLVRDNERVSDRDRDTCKTKKRRVSDSQRIGTERAIESDSVGRDTDTQGDYRPCDGDDAGFFFLLSGGKSAQKDYISQIHAVDAALQVRDAAPGERGVVCIPRAHGYDYRCTHLVMPELKRTHKFLCGVAGGAWVLKPSFLVAAVQCGSFSAVDPQEHEWYGAGTLPIPNSTGIW